MEDGNERRRISSAAAVVIAVGIGAAMAYLGFRLASFGAYAFSEGEPLLGVLAMVLGIALIGVPVVVLVSQVRAMFQRRG